MDRSRRPRRRILSAALSAVTTAFASVAFLALAANNSPAAAAAPQIGPETAVIQYNGAFNVFARGYDGHLRQWWYDGTWHDYVDLGGSIAAGTVPAVAIYNNQLQVWAKGMDGTLRQWWFDNGAWQQKNVNHGGTLRSGPAVAQYNNQFQVFATGADGTLRQWWYDGVWGVWQRDISLGGDLTNVPAVTQYNNQLQIWARGVDGTLRQWWYDGDQGTWHMNVSFGGAIASKPAVIQYNNQFQVFATGADGTLRQWWYDGDWGTWHNNISLGGDLGSPPAVALYGSQLQVWARGSDGTLRQWWYDGVWNKNYWRGSGIASGPSIAQFNSQFQVWALDDRGPLHQWWYDGSWHDAMRGGLPPNRTDDLSKPIYFVHGFSPWSPRKRVPGHNCADYWGTAMQDFQRGDSPNSSDSSDALITVGYYVGNKDCAVRLTEGNRDTNLIEIGRLFAWKIYNDHSQYGRSVDVVAHSMGGLILRAALTGTQQKLPGWPPFIHVEDAVTMATPHGGVNWCFLGIITPTTQCMQMMPGSPFLQWLDDNPQGVGGTDWTMMGAEDDDTVDAHSAIHMTPAHKLRYPAPQPTEVGIEHSLITGLINTHVYWVKKCNNYIHSTCGDLSQFEPPVSVDVGYYSPVYMARLAAYWHSAE